MAPSMVLMYRDSLPTGPTYEGIYFDDHLVTHMTRLEELPSSQGPDRELIERSHAACARHRVARSSDKAYGFAVEREPRRADTKFAA